jgi:cobalt-zinc-cadmium efflux system outer membrane protein
MFRWTFAALCSAVLGSLACAHAAEPVVSLDQAVARALDASASVRSREELIGGAEAGIRQSGVLPNPELEGELENFGGSGSFRGLEESELTAGVSQRIERSSKREGRVAVAQADRDIAAIERDKTFLDVAAEARRTYFEVCAATALLQVRKDNLASAQQIEVLATRRVRSARDPVTVKLRAEIQTGEARTAYDRAVLALETAKRKLASLWGEPNASFTVDVRTLFDVRPTGVAARIDGSPDLKISEATARRAASKVELERANARSDVTVGLGVRRFEVGGDLAAVVSLSVPIAIFDTNQGNIDQAAAQRRAAELDVVEARRTAEREAVSLQNDVNAARNEAAVIRRELLPRAEEALRAARRGYEAGAFSYFELSESQRTLSEIRARQIEVLRDLQFALAALERLSGGQATSGEQKP